MKATEEDFSNFSISFSYWRVRFWEMEGKENKEKKQTITPFKKQVHTIFSNGPFQMGM